MNPPVVLSLETATLGGSVFVARGEEPLATRLADAGISHSNTLLSDINDALTDAGLTLQDVDVFACAAGPGSFTGLRIGIATVKALAATLNRPCIGIPTLAAVAHAAGPSAKTVALLPAGRGEVFAQLFSVTHDDDVTALDSPAHLSPAKLMQKYGSTKELVWAGEGAWAQRELIAKHAREQGIELIETDAGHDSAWRLAPKERNLARHISTIALKQHLGGQNQQAAELKAIYVRPSDAELKHNVAE